MHISTRNKIKNFGLKHFCPICKSWIRRFKPAGENGRPNAVCPVCGSFERHRLVWLFFGKRTSLFTSRMKMLHAAPENCFIRRLKSKANLEYHSIDIASPLAAKKMSLTELEYPDETFDFFYCSHVLEHILDDRKAISEIFRVLKHGGKAIIMVPISREHTLEDPSVTSPEQRKRIFGQEDHVRIYGKDFKSRLENGGFAVDEINFSSSFNGFKRYFYGLSSELIFSCEKL